MTLHAVDAGLYRDARVVHVAPDMAEDLDRVSRVSAREQRGYLCLEAELADGFAVETGLFRRRGGRDFNLGRVSIRPGQSRIHGTYVFDTKVVEGLGNGKLGLAVEVGRGELLALAQRAVDEAKVGEVSDGPGVLLLLPMLVVLLFLFGRDVGYGGFQASKARRGALAAAGGAIAHGMACKVLGSGAIASCAVAAGAGTVAHGVAGMVGDGVICRLHARIDGADGFRVRESNLCCIFFGVCLQLLSV